MVKKTKVWRRRKDGVRQRYHVGRKLKKRRLGMRDELNENRIEAFIQRDINDDSSDLKSAIRKTYWLGDPEDEQFEAWKRILKIRGEDIPTRKQSQHSMRRRY